MTAELTGTSTARVGGMMDRAARSDAGRLRGVVILAALVWAVAFVLVGVWYRLEMYGDGSIFSYSVAARAGWAFHFHNISDRLFVYLYSHLPAETYVALSGDARGGIALYGILFFAAPLAGLAATFAADRSNGRVIFGCACLSTVVLCPMVFGFPTEMWVAHSLFWPALALCHYAPRGVAGGAAILAALLALVLTHEGALVFALAILATLALRGMGDAAFRRAAGTLAIAVAVWLAVRAELPPAAYYARIIPAAAFNFIDVRNLIGLPCFDLLLAALAGYGVVLLPLRRLAPAPAPAGAAAIMAVALAVYWLWFDRELNTQDRYYLRTAILVATPVLGALAMLCALRTEGRLRLPLPVLVRLGEFVADRASALTRGTAARAAVGALALVTLVHVVETAKFVTAWVRYEAAVRALATGTASDPALGDARFVSSERIDAELNRLDWSTTTHFLSVLVAPGLAPTRLVVDPHAGYFWLTCQLATAIEKADNPIPLASRALIRVHACLHR
jgi:hypothetical protein